MIGVQTMKDERAKWDEAAPEYQSVFRLGLNDYNSALLRFWQENGMLTPGCRVIDIGCGVGKYGAYLAGLGCDVTLTDISENMIVSRVREHGTVQDPVARSLLRFQCRSAAGRRRSRRASTLQYPLCRLQYTMQPPSKK